MPPFKDYPADYSQSQLFADNVFDLLPDDHDCFVYRDLFEQLDTAEVDARYSRRGQPAYAPRQIVSILIYAYSHGVFSSRQIEKRCNEDLGFMYIAGKRCPNFRVPSDFRKDRGDFFRSCFKQTVRMALELDVASLGHVSLDGSKFKANSSKHKAMSYGRMKEREHRLCEEIEALAERARRCDEEELRPGRAIGDKKQIGFADKDARIIVGQHVSQAANDQREVGRALDELEASSGRLPDKMSLDNGYYSGDNLRAVSDRGVEAYIATDRGEKPAATGVGDSDRPLVKADFRYDEARDGFHCPGGQFLTLRRVDARGRREYRGEAERGLRGLRLSRSLLPVEVRGGAHGDERRPRAVAPGDEREDVAAGGSGRLPTPQGDRGTGVRADQEHGFPGFLCAGQVEGGQRVLAGLLRAQRQENGPCGDRGSRAPGVRAKGGDGVESGPPELWK